MAKRKWQEVLCAADCIYEDWDDDHEMPICPRCEIEYADCECIGPTMDGYEYKEINGVLMARKEAK